MKESIEARNQSKSALFSKDPNIIDILSGHTLDYEGKGKRVLHPFFRPFFY
jgi:hypothetical protein